MRRFFDPFGRLRSPSRGLFRKAIGPIGPIGPSPADIAGLSPLLWFEPRISEAYQERPAAPSPRTTLSGVGDPVGEEINLGTKVASRFALADNNRPTRATAEILEYLTDDYLTLGERLVELEGGPEVTVVFVGRLKGGGSRILCGQGSGSSQYTALVIFTDTAASFYATTATDNNFVSLAATPNVREKYLFDANVAAGVKRRRIFAGDWSAPGATQVVGGGGDVLTVSNTEWTFGIRPTLSGFIAQPDEELLLVFPSELSDAERATVESYINFYYGL